MIFTMLESWGQKQIRVPFPAMIQKVYWDFKIVSQKYNIQNAKWQTHLYNNTTLIFIITYTMSFIHKHKLTNTHIDTHI